MLNAYHYSDGLGNHTAYKQWKGTKTTAEEISDIYSGLKQNYLTDFDVLLSGYAPSAEAVQAIGSIARDLKLKATTKPGTFFWGKIKMHRLERCNGYLLMSSSTRSCNGR